MAPRYRKTADRCLFILPRIIALFPLFRVSSSDITQLRALNEKAPGKGGPPKNLRNPKRFPRYSRRTHAVFTPSPPDPPFFEPKIFEKRRKCVILA